MPTTAQIVDENIRLVDGSGSNDPVVLDRWTRCVQRACNYIWNDRPWSFKTVEDVAFPYEPKWLNRSEPGSDNTLPSDFGSFQAHGAGVFQISPRRPIIPKTLGEANILLHGTQLTTLALGPVTRYTVTAGSSGPALQFYPELPASTTVLLIYQRRAPRCVYETSDGATDEIGWIPSQWHDLISDGARWINSHDVASSQEGQEQAFLKLGLDQMRDSEVWGTQGLNRIVGFRPNRRASWR